MVTGITEPATIKYGTKPIKAGDDGKFSVSFPLESGINTLSLVAVDAAGNETTWTKDVELVLQETIKISMWIGQPEAYVNGVRVYLQVPPTIKNGRTFVPVRFVSESLRSEVKWDGDTRSVTVIGPEHKCVVMIDSTTAFLDGQPLKLDAAPFIQNSTTLVPLRFIAQDTLNGEIGWDADEKRIDITVTYDIN
ncbi:MAG: stalk domain-containing protein [Caldisericia bacterium]